MMKKLAYVLMVTVFLIVNAASCSSETPANQQKVTLYFSNAEADSLVTETVYIDTKIVSDTKKLAETLLDKLIAGPTNPAYISTIPKDVYVRGVSLSSEESNTVNVDFGGRYYDFDKDKYASSELLTRYSIVKTLCQFDEIKKVKFYVNGTDMKSDGGNGEVLSSISSESVLINSPSSVETQTEKFVTLYFNEEDSQLLRPETRKATMSDNSLENTVVSELLRGPVDDKLERLIPEDVSLISIETAEAVCFVNFSENFMNVGEADSKKMKLAVYSVVNALTRLSGIDKVQILVEGKKPESDPQQLFSTPLERDETLIVEI